MPASIVFNKVILALAAFVQSHRSDIVKGCCFLLCAVAGLLCLVVATLVVDEFIFLLISIWYDLPHVSTESPSRLQDLANDDPDKLATSDQNFVSLKAIDAAQPVSPDKSSSESRKLKEATQTAVQPVKTTKTVRFQIDKVRLRQMEAEVQTLQHDKSDSGPASFGASHLVERLAWASTPECWELIEKSPRRLYNWRLD